MMESNHLSDRPFNPNSPFSWEVAIVIAAADVKPTVTGIEMKSTMNPTSKGGKNNEYIFSTRFDSIMIFVYISLTCPLVYHFNVAATKLT